MKNNNLIENFTPSEVFLAYKKVKHFFYYDNANLLEKEKLANFEQSVFYENIHTDCKSDFIDVQNALYVHILDFVNQYFNSKSGILELSKRIRLIKLPKKLKDSKLDIITNKPNSEEKYVIERTSKFADFPIEVHILSVLWIMYSGRYLQSDIHYASYANVLDFEFLNHKSEPSENLKLFKPYFVQYQLWRDSAINKAESLLEEKRDVTILSLDIKDFFHSISLNLEDVFEKIDFNVKKISNDKNILRKIKSINSIFFKIHHSYKSILEDYKNTKYAVFSLPVGLISSGLLSNYYLSELDNRIVSNLNPAFYGRYVDDLMFVFSDLNSNIDSNLNSSLISFLNKNFVEKGILNFKIENTDIKNIYFRNDKYVEYKNNINLSELEQYISKFNISDPQLNSFLVDNIKFEVKNIDIDDYKRYYQVFNYENLEIQSSKIVLHYLAHKESKAIINIFKRKLDNQRSEFRFLPDEDEISEKFDEEAFELKYNDSINKFRSISDFSENKYGASKFLAKMIFAKSYGNQEFDEDSDNQILTFFRGELAVKFYSLWEKVATYFIVSNRIDFLVQFKRNIENSIIKTEFSKDVEINKSQKDIFIEYLRVSLSIPLALNPSLVRNIRNIGEDEYKFFRLCEITAFKLRTSNLFRHSLMSIPASNLTNILYTKLSLLEKDFNYYDFENLGKKSKQNIKKDELFQLCKKLCYLAPNYVQFHEVNILRIIDVISNFDDKKKKIEIPEFNYLYPISESKKIPEDKSLDANIEHIINKIPDDSFNLYYFINYSWKEGFSTKKRENLKNKYFQICVLNSNGSIQALNIDIKGDNLKDEKFNGIDKSIAIANMKVHTSDMFASIHNSANVKKERRKLVFNLINDADRSNADLLVFPEVSIPYSWIRLLAERSHKRYMGIVAGLEHWVNKKKIVFNFLVTILPFKINHYNTSLVKLRLKNHYSHSETHLIKGYRLKIPNQDKKDCFMMTYDLFHWRKTYFSVYNCFELADIYHRSIFKSKVDFIIASEYNRDTNYFSDIAGAWVRDIHSYFIQVNSSDFGDSRIIQPAKSYEKDLVQVKGGLNSVVLIDKLKISDLRAFQFKEYHLQKDDIDKGKTAFKPTPPDFDRENVKMRIKNKDFK
ncbi:reverse transcriptase domain-containing protein [Elizabethkingia ursingii]|uniref:reverse transcriptase domain-containing protein n=1 Tax=Elizabethkingia ursingii TaxID=1756150 RepID=UPI002011BCCA|nr:reverse transcriptase domain-containing protein [Elizabethkingia ursingii]MCL1670515.1 reverse transcriptase domain-containing protein [Elizabethkingia ursingii]